MNTSRENIMAPATPQGTGAIAVLRLSGPDVIRLTDELFRSPAGKLLTDAKGYTLHYGELRDGEELLDEVLVSVFRAPHSYTGEDAVEISLHGSPYIMQRVMEWFSARGVRPARPGEFTMRAFLNGKMDLTRAEAVADLIEAETEAQHRVAMHQLRGGFYRQLQDLRRQLVELTALMELELDFAEEDVEFADRSRLTALLRNIKTEIKRLIDSFSQGNVIKHGVAVAIAGAPNTGKSTLLNTLLNEEKAIVTHIPGTTRDTIEDVITLQGIRFRFIDTAGIRQTDDHVEKIGIQRSFRKINEARLVLWLADALRWDEQKDELRQRLADFKTRNPDQPLFLLINKIDAADEALLEKIRRESASMPADEVLFVSAKHKEGIARLEEALVRRFRTDDADAGATVVTNIRHYHALRNALQSLTEAEEAFAAGLSTDLIAVDLRDVLQHLGEITGEITPDDLLEHIFNNFCIGK
ncbi:MAG: tRNA uridine-5-carboxymethylaminomethyl(34) synthesis GTPase MnmE [Chlorobi bacterium]|nr:tRNA uridine-5-carboxymethylaminomethyl(34) synthesis GTPase MnmE [Chlorobiota bacterium]